VPAIDVEGLSEAARDAWSGRLLGACSPATARELLADAREIVLAGGATFYRSTLHAETEKLGLVVTGLLRTFRRSTDGRQVTLRYTSPGRVIGLPAVLGHGGDIEGQALLESRVLTFSAARFRAARARGVGNARDSAARCVGGHGRFGVPM
jgi:CRP-like cAMP-binding protein